MVMEYFEISNIPEPVWSAFDTFKGVLYMQSVAIQMARVSKWRRAELWKKYEELYNI